MKEMAESKARKLMREGMILGMSIEQEVDDRDDNMEMYGAQASRMVDEENTMDE